MSLFRVMWLIVWSTNRLPAHSEVGDLRVDGLIPVGAKSTEDVNDDDGFTCRKSRLRGNKG